MSEAGGGGDGEAGLPRLPPGRHGLPREFVVENQRRRIAAGMIAVVVEQGYPAASVTQVVAAAGVSRRTFYNYYSDAPVSRFILEMKGGKKYGLLENSENLCKEKQKGIATFTAQTGKVDKFEPLVQNSCKKKGKGKKKSGTGRASELGLGGLGW